MAKKSGEKKTTPRTNIGAPKGTAAEEELYSVETAKSISGLKRRVNGRMKLNWRPVGGMGRFITEDGKVVFFQTLEKC